MHDQFRSAGVGRLVEADRKTRERGVIDPLLEKSFEGAAALLFEHVLKIMKAAAPSRAALHVRAKPAGEHIVTDARAQMLERGRTLEIRPDHVGWLLARHVGGGPDDQVRKRRRVAVIAKQELVLAVATREVRLALPGRELGRRVVDLGKRREPFDQNARDRRVDLADERPPPLVRVFVRERFFEVALARRGVRLAEQRDAVARRAAETRILRELHHVERRERELLTGLLIEKREDVLHQPPISFDQRELVASKRIPVAGELAATGSPPKLPSS